MPVQQNNGDSDESAGDCSGEEAAPSACKNSDNEHVKKTSESTTFKRVKKPKRSSKSAQPRLIGTSQTPRLSEKVRLPLSADSKRSLMKSRAQQHQLVLQSLGVQGRSFGQRRDLYCQTSMSKPCKTETGGQNCIPDVEHSDSATNTGDENNADRLTSDVIKSGSGATSDHISSAISGLYSMTLCDAPQSDISSMMLAQQKYNKQDLVQLFTLPTGQPTKANFFPPINQLNKNAMVTQFGYGTSVVRPASSGNATQCFSDGGAASPFIGTELLDITENDLLADDLTKCDLLAGEQTKCDLLAERQTKNDSQIEELTECDILTEEKSISVLDENTKQKCVEDDSID